MKPRPAPLPEPTSRDEVGAVVGGLQRRLAERRAAGAEIGETRNLFHCLPGPNGYEQETMESTEAFAGTEDEALKEDVEGQERSLLYVAITRAKREVLVTWSGRGSGWVRETSRA